MLAGDDDCPRAGRCRQWKIVGAKGAGEILSRGKSGLI